MVIDCHLHLCTFTPEHGGTSAHLLSTLPFRFMRWRLGMTGADASTERQLERKFAELMAGTPQVDAAVVLAFDAVYGDDGELDQANTHLYVTNDYVLDLSRRRKNVLFGASVHPYRKDALTELQRCIDRGAVLLKWLPIVQGFDPSDPRCFPLYEMLAHHQVPLLAHTGGEKSLPNINPHVADPTLLLPALQRGVTVIAAHCGTKSAPGERDFLPEWCRLARDYENFYGDTAALNLPTRCYAYRTILPDERLRSKLIHGSDWPIIPLPPLSIGLSAFAEVMGEENWIRRDVMIKEALGFDRDYWLRAAKVLRLLPSPSGRGNKGPAAAGPVRDGIALHRI